MERTNSSLTKNEISAFWRLRRRAMPEEHLKEATALKATKIQTHAVHVHTVPHFDSVRDFQSAISFLIRLWQNVLCKICNGDHSSIHRMMVWLNGWWTDRCFIGYSSSWETKTRSSRWISTAHRKQPELVRTFTTNSNAILLLLLLHELKFILLKKPLNKKSHKKHCSKHSHLLLNKCFWKKM